VLNELDACVARHILAHNGHGAVSAGAGNDNDLANLHTMEMLIKQGGQQRANVFLLVVGGHTYAAHK
jgi:hypothetical protein